MITEPTYSDKVFQMLIDLNDGKTFDIEKNVRPENREKFYEIVQYFRESEFCKDVEIIMTETFLKKRKKGKWFNLTIREESRSPEPVSKEEKSITNEINPNTNEQPNTLRGEQGTLF